MLKSGSSWKLVPLPTSNTKRGERGVLKAPRLDQEEGQLIQLLGLASKPTNKLVNSHSESLLVLGQATSNTDSLDSPRPKLGGNPHRPPSSILCVAPRHPHPNGFQSQDSQGGVPKLSWFRLLGLLGAHDSQLRLLIGMRYKAHLQFSSKSFQRCVALHLHTPGSRRFPTFSGRESNYQFDSRPFFRL